MIEDYFHKLFQKLFVSPAVSSLRTVKQRVQEEDGYLRIKCRLQNAQWLEFAEYVQVHGDVIIVITYNYQWQDAHGDLVKRWDNVPHHKGVDSFPHHLHISETEVISSGPTTLQDVLTEIEESLR
jgi:hypothetical protein